MGDVKAFRWLLPLFFLLLVAPLSRPDGIYSSQKHRFLVEELAANLRHPWGMVFLPDRDILVTERGGRLLRLAGDGNSRVTIAGIPKIREKGQGGLLGIALHPNFSQNQWVYLAFTRRGAGGYGTEVMRGRLEDNRLQQIESIFTALPKSSGGRHFGGRLVFAADGSLYISLGDRAERPAAQNINDHRGSLIRLTDTGGVPRDNPFTAIQEARPEIYTYGHRNIQGMTVHPKTGEIWTHEHGPQGGDEINIISAGVNYGWPIITYGVNYGSGTRIGEGSHKAGMAQPIHTWTPSIAPSGMSFYTADHFTHWQGNLAAGSLKFGLLIRLEIEGDRVLHEERLLDGQYGRIRDVVQGPDGYLYLLTDAANGKLLRIRPAS